MSNLREIRKKKQFSEYLKCKVWYPNRTFSRIEKMRRELHNVLLEYNKVIVSGNMIYDPTYLNELFSWERYVTFEEALYLSMRYFLQGLSINFEYCSNIDQYLFQRQVY